MAAVTKIYPPLTKRLVKYRLYDNVFCKLL